MPACQWLPRLVLAMQAAAFGIVSRTGRRRLGVAVLVAAGSSLGAAPATADEPAGPRLTPMVRLIRQIEPGVAALFSQGENGTLSSGSGSVIHPAGFILTNDHVVRDRPGVVLLRGSPPLPYRLVGRIPEKDLAVVKVDLPQPVPPIPFGRSHDLMAGEPCLCAGNPGGRGITFTAGIISAPAIMIDAPNALVMAQFATDGRDRFVQFDAASNPGNSGGPLVNAEGRQVGVVTAIQKAEQNVSYAIPIDRVRQVADELLAPEVTRDLYAGLTIDPLAATATVLAVAADSPAAAAGLQVGDVLHSAAGQPLQDGITWLCQLSLSKAGDTLPITYLRAGQEQRATLTLAAYPTLAAVEVADAKPGLAWRLYRDGVRADFPDFARLQPVDQGVTSDLTPRRLAGPQASHFALQFEGYLKIPETGLYRLVLASDDGSRLYLHDRLLIDNSQPHPRREVGGKIRLAAGLHPIRIDYFEATGDAILEAFLEVGSDRQPLGAEHFRHRTREAAGS